MRPVALRGWCGSWYFLYVARPYNGSVRTGVTLLRESIKIPGLCRRMSVAVVGLVCSDQLS
jgi:hypothetical protein